MTIAEFSHRGRRSAQSKTSVISVSSVANIRNPESWKVDQLFDPFSFNIGKVQFE